MSKRLFQVFSVAMVVTMLLVSVGVKPALAADFNDFRDSRTTAQLNPATWTDFPFGGPPFTAGYISHDAINMATAGGSAVGNMAGCSVAPGAFGPMQLFLYDSNARTGTRYIRIHYRATQNSGDIAIGVFRASDLLEYGCTMGTHVGADQIFDLVVAVPSNVPYYVVLSDITGTGAWDGSSDIWLMNGSQVGGGLIVTGVEDCDVVQVYDGTNRATFTVPCPTAEYNAWFDVPAGVYAVGVARPVGGGGTDNPLAAAYPALAGGFRSLTGADTPSFAAYANVPITLVARNELGIPIANGTLSVIPSNGSLFMNMNLGVVADGVHFHISPGMWDAQLVRDDTAGIAAKDYFLASSSLGWAAPGSLTLNAQATAALVRFNTGVLTGTTAYNDCMYQLDPPGPLGPVNILGTLQQIDWNCDAVAIGVDGSLYLTAGTNFAASITLEEPANWLYYFVPTIPTWNFPINIVTAAYLPIFGGINYGSTASMTSGAGLTFNRAAWTDTFGNTLFRITAPDGSRLVCGSSTTTVAADGLRDEIAPCDRLRRGVAGNTTLANDWLTTALGPVTAIGRYQYTRSLQVSAHVVSENSVAQGYITVPDADVSNPFFNYIMALYEAGVTTGMTATSYGSDLPITRGQLARYLSQALVFGELVKPVGPAAATFTDVPTTHVFYADVQWLNLLGITTGTSATVFGVNDYATRETMAVWAEKAGRWMALNGAAVAMPDPNLGTEGPGGSCWIGWFTVCNTVYFDDLFVDVPSTNANALWIEEAAADEITVGISGTPGNDPNNWMYGPALPITRGQMAAFIGRSVLPANPGFVAPWVFPSPMK